MLLKRLVLQGYKTFATKTEFVFDEGVTAVVGPNGSGKSNVADAVRWVLGEQSYRTLRGRQTTDMIFAGSRSRPRAGMAQVVLTLDNSDGWLPIDFSEVEIGRRAYRSGENEYLLNGQRVRLRDIQELLATSGLAERTYTIIGQGLIDQALSLKSDERRALFEEAAGISHYKARRAETLRRLTDTERNLQRVFDILSEIRPRLNSLRRQANRARNYEQVAADLRYQLRIYYGYRWEQMKKELRRRRQEKGAAEKEWQSARADLVNRQEALNAQRRAINGLERQLDEKQGARDMLRGEIEAARRRVAVLAERQQLLAEQWQGLEDELPRLDQQRSSAQAELNEALQALESARREQQSREDALHTFRTEFKSKQAAIDHWRSEQRRLTAEQSRQQQQQAVAEGRLSQLQERLEEREAEAVTAAVLQEAAARAAAAETGLQEAEKGVADAEAALLAAQAAAREAQQALRGSRRQEQDLGRTLNQLDREVARLEARAEMLAQYGGERGKRFAPAPAAARLAAGLTIPEAWQQAIEAALQERLATILVDDDAALWALLAAEPDQRLLAAVRDQLEPPTPPVFPEEAGVITPAARLVETRADVAPLAALLLERVALVDDRETALRVGRRLPAGCLAVSPDGFVVHAGGLVELVPADPRSSILAREAARREARAALDDAVSRRDLEAAARVALRETISSQEEALQVARRQEQEANEALQPARQAQSSTRYALERARQRQQDLQEQQARHAQDLARFRERISALEEEISRGDAQRRTLEAAVSQAGVELEALPVAEAQQQRESLQQSIESARTITAGRQAVVDSRRTTLTQVDAQRERLLARREEIAAARRELDMNASQDTLQQYLDAQQQLDDEIAPLQVELREGREQLNLLEEALGSAQSSAHQLETGYTQTNIRLSQQENQIEGLLDRIRADLGIVNLTYDDDQAGPTPLPMSEVVEQLPVVEELPDDIDESIQRARAQLQRMGGVNPDAPAEYDETQERFDFLNEQVDDLQETEKQLRAIIAELDDLTSRAFAETVEKVDQVFGLTFTQLFGGGSARLVLTEPDDLTITGVDIVAQLPRRRQQGLGLLSGGERSLTAVALIFSLLKVSPTPFCIMDEVDAMLDEANVNRFRDLLRELSLQTQFVVITHNRGTVQAAQTVYGISMGSDSTSQVISIKPEEFINARELL